MALLQDSDNLDEYAFALGAMSHYTSDVEAHPAVNRAVALDYPKLERMYGPEVIYEDNHRAHIRTEFGFDVVQVAKGRFTPVITISSVFRFRNRCWSRRFARPTASN